MTESSAALPVAHVVLRILRVLNWLSGAAIFLLLVATVVAQAWTFEALGIARDSQIAARIVPLQGIAVLGVVCVAISDFVLRRLQAIVGTVRDGEPFVGANAQRLLGIGWALLWLQVASIAIAALARMASTPANPMRVDAGFSIAGWLAVLLIFILARVFAEGARMREDLDGTV